jgi:CRISPR-associated exonuclease Cas4
MKLSSIPASLLRQYAFCPRIPYFQEVVRARPVEPLWVQQGRARHEREALLMKCRSLNRFGFVDADVKLEIDLASETLGLHGRADAILSKSDSVAVIEFKLSHKRPTRGELLQLTAYGMMAEEQEGRPLKKLFVLSSVHNRPKVVEVTELSTLRHSVLEVVAKLHRLFNQEVMPESSASTHQCGQCEYLLFCNDRF